jgi:hypothetical protein
MGRRRASKKVVEVVKTPPPQFITDAKKILPGNYKVIGYTYPFQEARHWLKRSGRNIIGTIHNTHANCVRLIDALYATGTELILIPGGDNDDYSEQVYVLTKDVTTLSKDIETLHTIIDSGMMFVEKLTVINSDLEMDGIFIVIDWSDSARIDDGRNREFRYREEM